MTRAGRPHPALALVVAPLPAVVIGAALLRGAGLPAGTRLLNGAAAVAGALLVGAAWMRRRGAPRADGAPRWIVPIALALLGAALVAPGAEGVHRWLPLGPLRLHAGALVLPALLVALADARWIVSAGTALIALALLAAQPDAAQAAAFCAGWCVLAAARPGRGAPAVAAAAVALAAASLLRPDPLGPVPHVEGIVGMAADRSPVLAAGALLALALPPLACLTSVGGAVGAALAVHLVGALAAAWLGHHPVPFLGFGVSPILGFYCAAVLVGGGASRGPGTRPGPRYSLRN